MGQLFSFSNGVNAAKESYGKGFRFVNVLEPITFSHLHGPEIPGRVEVPAAVAEAYAVKPGDVLFNRTSETDAELGMAAVYLGSEQVVFGGFVIRGRPVDHSLDVTYSGYALRAPLIRGQIVPMGQGAIRANIGQSNLSRVICPVPSLVEQRAIGAALSDVDALLSGLDRLIAKKGDLKRAAMQQLLTGQTRIPGVGREWKMVSLDSIVTKTAGFWGLEKRDVGHQNHVEVIRAGDIAPDGKLTATATRYFSDDELAMAQCRRGDVVITGSGSVGKVWWCDGRSDVAASNFVRVLRPRGELVDGRYLFQLLLSDATQRLMVEHVATGVMANLGSSFFTKEWLPLPPLAEQRAIAEILCDMDAELVALQARRDKTRDLRHAMMQELLTGKSRLV